MNIFDVVGYPGSMLRLMWGTLILPGIGIALGWIMIKNHKRSPLTGRKSNG